MSRWQSLEKYDPNFLFQQMFFPLSKGARRCPLSSLVTHCCRGRDTGAFPRPYASPWPTCSYHWAQWQLKCMTFQGGTKNWLKWRGPLHRNLVRSWNTRGPESWWKTEESRCISNCKREQQESSIQLTYKFRGPLGTRQNHANCSVLRCEKQGGVLLWKDKRNEPKVKVWNSFPTRLPRKLRGFHDCKWSLTMQIPLN